MSKPVLSIILATFNSEKTLPLVLEALEKQTLSKTKYELLALDGGSTDQTHAILRKYHGEIINNPHTEPVHGKFLGYKRARGKYIMYLDHDEVLENTKSLEVKLACFLLDKRVKAVIGSGYSNPKGYSVINEYINDFGDPFSFFIYRLGKTVDNFIPTMMRRYQTMKETDNCVIFDLHNIRNLPIIELVAGGSMFDAQTLKKEFQQTLQSQDLLPHFFYLLYTKYPFIAMTKNDTITHYSADTLQKFLKKIEWRVKNNIYHVSTMGMSGFTGRNKYNSRLVRLKKYVFLLYALTCIFPLIDALLLTISRKKSGYLIHFPLTLCTAWFIIYHSILKLLGVRPLLQSYGRNEVVKTG